MPRLLSRKAPPPAVEPKPEYTEENRPYSARGAALELWKLRHDEVLIEGPAGTGKTRAILEKLNFCCMKYPNMRGLLVRKTRESLTETVLVTLEEKVLPAGSSMLRGPKRSIRQLYRYPNGSVIIVGGMDKVEKVMSSEYDMICCFETTEFTEDDFEALTTRLRNGRMPYQQIIADCNPSGPNHWLNKRPDDGTDRMIRLKSRHEDNPVYFDVQNKSGKQTFKPTVIGAKYLKRLQNLSGVRRLRLFLGIWAAAEGLVYEEYDATVHLIPRFDIPSDWTRYRAVDFGYRNPFVCQWWAEDHEGNLYRYREIYKTALLVQDAAKQMIELSAGEKFEATIADHDLEDRETLHAAGILTLPAYKDFQRGKDAVKERLKLRRNSLDQLRPRVFLLRDSLVEEDTDLKSASKPTRTEEEFDGYVFKVDKEDKAVKEEPVKKDDHGVDALRYMIAHVDNLHGMCVRVETDDFSVIDKTGKIV